jgi:hypothetical protein
VRLCHVTIETDCHALNAELFQAIGVTFVDAGAVASDIHRQTALYSMIDQHLPLRVKKRLATRECQHKHTRFGELIDNAQGIIQCELWLCRCVGA